MGGESEESGGDGERLVPIVKEASSIGFEESIGRWGCAYCDERRRGGGKEKGGMIQAMRTYVCRHNHTKHQADDRPRRVCGLRAVPHTKQADLRSVPSGWSAHSRHLLRPTSFHVPAPFLHHPPRQIHRCTLLHLALAFIQHIPQPFFGPPQLHALQAFPSPCNLKRPDIVGRTAV